MCFARGRRLNRSSLEHLEWNPDDVGIFGRVLVDGDSPLVRGRLPVLVITLQVVVLAPQGASRDLFAEQLGSKGAQSHDVGDGVGVPSLREHRDRDHAPDVSAKISFLADRVDHFTKDFSFRDGLSGALAMHAGILPPKGFDLRSENLSEVVVNLVGILQGIAIDQQGRGFFNGLLLFRS